MLPISIGILSWRSNKSIRNTLNSYHNFGLLSAVNELKLFFQQYRKEDIELAERYNIPFMTHPGNIGIGKAFMQLAKAATEEYILLLEHDWELVERENFLIKHLSESIRLLNEGVSCVRLRHRKYFGFPHYSISRYKGNELGFYDDWIQLKHPHLLDAVHWKCHPDKLWPDKIEKTVDFYISDSRYANWTNNPCLFKRDFYISAIDSFSGEGIDLEKNISHWWARQVFKVAQGKGLFMHNDCDKYPTRFGSIIKQKIRSLFSIGHPIMRF